MTTPTIGAIRFEPPLADPSPGGLYPVTTWQDATGPSRFLIDGVEVRVHNYGGEDASGVGRAVVWRPRRRP